MKVGKELGRYGCSAGNRLKSSAETRLLVYIYAYFRFPRQKFVELCGTLVIDKMQSMAGNCLGASNQHRYCSLSVTNIFYAVVAEIRGISRKSLKFIE